MKIYVAGKWEERERIRDIYKLLQQNNHEITVDWTDHDYPKDDIDRTLSVYAMQDINGVVQANMVVCIAENKLNYRGMLVELGVAIAFYKPVIIIGQAINSCIFTYHPYITKVDNITQAIDIINKRIPYFNGAL